MSAVQKKMNLKGKNKTHFYFKGIRFYGCLFLFYIVACTNHQQKIYNMLPLVKSGDIIVRNSNDEISDVARSFNRKDKSYSHCGIILIEKGRVVVYHALGGDYNPSQKLMRQSLEDFCNVRDVDKIALFRYKLNDKELKKLDSIINLQYKAGLPFDLFFNFTTDDKMYCSEFVFKTLNAARSGTLSYLLHQNEQPLYVSIDDLYLNKEAKKVAEIIL